MLGKRTEGSSLYVLYSGGTPSPWRVHTHRETAVGASHYY